MSTEKFPCTVHAKLPRDTPTSGQRWQTSGIVVRSGEQVSVKYIDGLWTANPATGMVTAAGNSQYKAKSGYALPGANEGALIGRITDNNGSSDPFLIGLSGNVPTNREGYLEFVINDDMWGEYGDSFADNKGSINVMVSVTR